MKDFDHYFAYLTRRSRLGRLYRYYWLYPRLCRELQGRVLDIGCGIGDLLAFRPNTVGVDINPKLVAYCRTRDLDAHEMPIDQLPFDNATFDGAVLDNVLEHILEPQPLLAEVHRILRPGGTLLVGVPGTLGYDTDPDHKVFYDRIRLLDTLASEEFLNRQVFYMPFKFNPFDSRLPQYCLYGLFER